MLLNSSTQFGFITRWLHWISAAWLLLVILLGWVMDDDNYGSSQTSWLQTLHYGLGSLFLGLTLIRFLFWRIQKQPPMLGNPSALAQTIKSSMMLSLYTLMLLMPLTGYLSVAFQGNEVSVLGWFSLPALSEIHWLQDLLEEFHEILANLLLFLIALHVLAALKHHLIDGDNTLKRMLGRD